MNLFTHFCLKISTFTYYPIKLSKQNAIYVCLFSQELIRENALEDDEKTSITCRIKSLKEDLELRSTQIVDLKQKLQSLDSYQGN